MKATVLKFRRSAIGILFSSLLFSSLSCSNEPKTAISQPTQMEQEQALISNLRNINNELLFDLQTRAVTSQPHEYLYGAKMRWIGEKGWDVIFADAAGAWAGGKFGFKIGIFASPSAGAVLGVGGAIIGGVVASLYEYHHSMVDNGGSNNDSPYSGFINSGQLYNPEFIYANYLEISQQEFESVRSASGVVVAIPDEYKEIEKIGIAHNILLEKLQTADLMSEQYVIPQDDPMYEIVKTPEFIAAYREMVDDIISGKLKNEFMAADYENYELSSVASDIIKLFTEVYALYPRTLEDVDFVINKYVDSIEASGKVLSEEDKGIIYSGLSTAAYSPRFWAE